MSRRGIFKSKMKTMTCGHEQTFATPVPEYGDNVWCLTCDAPSSIPKKESSQPRRVADGRPRRLTPNPRSNNQYTKGRQLVTRGE